ncbi:MAG: AAA family ATPase [Phycisphaerales bacterium]|nr:AAA family ATPase [Phycisphaerales bacterium]
MRVLAKTYHRFGARLSPTDLGRLDEMIARLQAAPSQSGMGLERIDGAIDPGMWAIRLGPDLLAVVHVDADRLTILRVGQPDDVLPWARATRVRVHPITGRVQIVEMPPPAGPDDAAEAASTAHLDFGRYGEGFLASLGVPEEWIERVRSIRNETQFWFVHSRMPEEVAELLYALALGETVEPPKPIPVSGVGADADSQRRLFAISDDEDLAAFLSRPFEQWMLYLHPSQRSVVEAEYAGPSKITGSAGTGKTVVGLHRAHALARQHCRVLVTTFTNTLAKSLYAKLCQLCEEPLPWSAITVLTTHKLTMELLAQGGQRLRFAKQEDVHKLIAKHGRRSAFDAEFLNEEWDEVIAHHGLRTWEEYRDIPRAGRGVALQPAQREAAWGIFGPVIADLTKRGLWPWGHLCRTARELIEAGTVESPFDAVIVDEVQDLSTQEIRLLASLPRKGLTHFMLIGDAGQRIYPGGFSLRSLGLETRGRSRRLNINYRTTLEIERAAARLRDTAAVDDLDGDSETPLATHSLLRGPKPHLAGFAEFKDEDAFVARSIQRLLADGVQPHEIAVFARTWRFLYHLRTALRAAGVPVSELRQKEFAPNEVVLATMHGAKGLEFRYVFVIACRESAVPADFALKAATDADAVEVVTRRERSLLYVAMTRARDGVYISWSGQRSPFLDAIEPHCESVSHASDAAPGAAPDVDASKLFG